MDRLLVERQRGPRSEPRAGAFRCAAPTGPAPATPLWADFGEKHRGCSPETGDLALVASGGRADFASRAFLRFLIFCECNGRSGGPQLLPEGWNPWRGTPTAVLSPGAASGAAALRASPLTSEGHHPSNIFSFKCLASYPHSLRVYAGGKIAVSAPRGTVRARGAGGSQGPLETYYPGAQNPGGRVC